MGREICHAIKELLLPTVPDSQGQPCSNEQLLSVYVCMHPHRCTINLVAIVTVNVTENYIAIAEMMNGTNFCR